MSYDPKVVLDDLGVFLESKGIGTVAKTLFLGRLPSQPLECVAVILLGGTKIRGNPIDFPSLQILARARELVPALSLVTKVYPYFNHTVPALARVRMRAVPEHLPGPYYTDVDGRFVATLNFGLYVTP